MKCYVANHFDIAIVYSITDTISPENDFLLKWLLLMIEVEILSTMHVQHFWVT